MSDEKVLEIERVFDAPRERVFRAWTDPKDLVQWSGPRDWPAVSCEGEVRPGSRWQNVIRCLETGEERRMGGVYREVVAPERLVYTFAWNTPGEENPETLVTVRFEDLGNRTRMRFRQEPFADPANREGHRNGWSSSFDRLVDLLVAAANAA